MLLLHLLAAFVAASTAASDAVIVTPVAIFVAYVPVASDQSSTGFKITETRWNSFNNQGVEKSTIKGEINKKENIEFKHETVKQIII